MSHARKAWRYVPRVGDHIHCLGCGGESFFDAEYETVVTLVPHTVKRFWTGELYCNRCKTRASLPIVEMTHIYGEP